MQFSGKITNSVLIDLQNRGCEFEHLLESSELTREFMKDPSGFLDAHKVEQFLEAVEKFAADKLGIENYIAQLGLKSPEMRAWGALDSVLRMIEKPQNIFLQPQRFLSYFISPPPPIADVKRTEYSVSFEVPIFRDEYPLVVTYITSAIESVPLFMGGANAEAKWTDNHITISWADGQSLLGGEDFNRRHMAPEIMQNLISALEKSEQKLIEQSRELERIKNENRLAAQSSVQSSADLIQLAEGKEKVQSRLMRLQDYFTRSQQLITLLIGQDRMNSQVREAMKRVNWDQVQKSYPEVTQELLNIVKVDSAQNPDQHL